MTALAWILFLVGTLLAAATGAHLPPIWPVFGVGIAMSVGGAVLLRRQAAGRVGDTEGDGITDVASLRAALAGVGEDLEALAQRPVDDALKLALEGILLDKLMPAVEARGLLLQAHGVEAHAKVFTPVATAERCMNRAWSALVDGVPEETSSELGKARAHLGSAVAAFPDPG
jgi:hypothetical protein